MRRPALLTIPLAVSLAACGSKAAKKQSAPPPAIPTATAQPEPAPVPASPNVSVGDDLAKQCSLRFANVEAAPKFDYNDAELLTEDRNVLQQIADCLMKGPLKGRRVQLVGRADPRGTDEYNLGLGTRRAETVRVFLQRLGVPDKQLTATTRGELDASGSDETSWRRDRRVDLTLVN